MEINNKKNGNKKAHFFDVFGDGFDRFDFPADIYRVTAGNGGEALLINGSEKTALLDCGMAYCGEGMVKNLKATLASLGKDDLDYVLLSHSHYDHIGALPYVREAFPEAVVWGSEYCGYVFERPGARKTIQEMGVIARDLYDPGNDTCISADGLRIDRILKDGDIISLGNEKVRVLETKGHTDCSLSFALEPVRLLFASESLGVVESLNYVYAPILKDFSDAFAGLEKCKEYRPEYISLAHFGMLPQEFNEKYWELFDESCHNVLDMVRELKEKGLSEEEISQAYIDRYWIPETEQEHPKEAFDMNTRAVVKAALKAL